MIKDSEKKETKKKNLPDENQLRCTKGVSVYNPPFLFLFL